MSVFKIECAACKRRATPAGLFICLSGAWYCRNR